MRLGSQIWIMNGAAAALCQPFCGLSYFLVCVIELDEIVGFTVTPLAYSRGRDKVLFKCRCFLQYNNFHMADRKSVV